MLKFFRNYFIFGNIKLCCEEKMSIYYLIILQMGIFEIAINLFI